MTTYAKFEKLNTPTMSTLKVEIDAVLQSRVAHHVGPGLATLSQVADYLQVGRRGVKDTLEMYGVSSNAAGRVKWEVLWAALWHIPKVRPAHYSCMIRPLLSVADVAKLAGVSEKSIVRDGDRKLPRYELPRHVQLSKRNRRFNPAMILLWEMNEALEDWMRPVACRTQPFRGPRPRLVIPKVPLSLQKWQSSDNCVDIRKNDKRSLL